MHLQNKYSRTHIVLQKLKAASILKKLGPTMGISLDQRRKNMSLEGVCSLMSSFSRYKTKLVIFPSCARKLVIPLEMSLLRPSRSRATITRGGKKHLVEVVKVIDEVKAYKVYGKLRVERMNWHQLGARMKKATRVEKEEK